MQEKKGQQFLRAALAASLCLAGCKVANEYVSQAEAIQVAAGRQTEISAIGALERNFLELWSNEKKLNEWKESAIPVMEKAGVTNADLVHRTSSGNPAKPFFRKVLLSGTPKSEITQGGGGWIPNPARYAISGSYWGKVVASRGRSSLHGRDHALYAYDFFGEESDYWLRCVFWDPPPLVSE